MKTIYSTEVVLIEATGQFSKMFGDSLIEAQLISAVRLLKKEGQ
jgi:hypothetical protein